MPSWLHIHLESEQLGMGLRMLKGTVEPTVVGCTFEL